MNNIHNDEDFANLVQKDLKTGDLNNEEIAFLSDSTNLEDWYLELQNIISKIDIQIALDKADHAKKQQEFSDWIAKKAQWRASTLGFRRFAQKRLQEVKRMRVERTKNKVQTIDYRSAIIRHKEIVAGGIVTADSEDADAELWAIIGE